MQAVRLRVHMTASFARKHPETARIVQDACSHAGSLWKLIPAADYEVQKSRWTKKRKRDTDSLLWLDEVHGVLEFHRWVRRRCSVNRHQSTTGKFAPVNH